MERDTTFYPGQVTWGRLTDARQYPGADRIAEEIKRQWIWTVIASLSLIVERCININLLMYRREDAK